MDELETPWEWQTRLALAPVRHLFTQAAKYFGLLVAGQAEFGWVVDVKLTDYSRDLVATGNLINHNWVLTACCIAEDWANAEQCAGPSGSSSMEVNFCANYIYEEFLRYDLDNRRLVHEHDTAGQRIVTRLIRHPMCNCRTRLYNFLLVKVNTPIDPRGWVVGYMPSYGGNLNDNILTLSHAVFPTLHNQIANKLLCYVASFGRRYWNVQSPQHESFKVKYRAYYSDYSFCTNDDIGIPDHLCASIGDEDGTNGECANAIKTNGGESGQFMCFRTYSSTGVVCDHDRGAPIVCNGEVYGFVVRGVQTTRCWNTRPFPFIVAKINALEGSHFGELQSDFKTDLRSAPIGMRKENVLPPCT